MRVGRSVRALHLLTGVTLVLQLSTVDSGAAATYRSTAKVTRTVTSTVSARVSATASATVGTPPATATGTGTAIASARVTRTSTVTAVGRGHSRKAARRAATRRAAGRAVTNARAMSSAAAGVRARQLARAAANRNAMTAAKANATAAAARRAPAAPAGVPCNGAAPAGGSTTCTFADEFEGATLDTTKWSAVTTAGSGYRNNPAECFVDSPDTISQSDGTLKLTTRPAPGYACRDHATDFVSGSVSSIGKFSQAYGTYSIRAKFPATTVAGLHSALWMWPNDQTKYVSWPMSGEIDIAERYSVHNDRSIPYLHYVYDPSTFAATSVTGSTSTGYSMAGTNVATNNYCLQPDPDAFHVYTMTWQPGRIAIWFDGVACMTDDYAASDLPAGAPFDQPFFLILTQALGAAGTPNEPTDASPDTGTTEVDYVRVWQ